MPRTINPPKSVIDAALANNKKKKEVDEWICGYACAVANYLQIEGCVNAWLRDVFQSGIGTVERAKSAGVDEFDLKILKKHRLDLEFKSNAKNR